MCSSQAQDLVSNLLVVPTMLSKPLLLFCLLQLAVGQEMGVSADGSTSQMRLARMYKPKDIAGETVLITGATAGIGAACAWQFAEAGCNVVLAGRRQDRLDGLKIAIGARFPNIKVHSVKLDVTDINQVTSVMEKLPKSLKGVDILINNAGLALGLASVEETSIADITRMVNTNVLGLMAMTTTVTKVMKERQSGHVINIGSVSGHYTYAGGSVYAATKFAVDGYTQAVRQDLVSTPLRVTLISPGMVETEFSEVRFKGDKSKAEKVYSGISALTSQDVADQVLYAATRPGHVQIAEIVVWPTNQVQGKTARMGPSLGRK